jgi:hypothetical protein
LPNKICSTILSRSLTQNKMAKQKSKLKLNQTIQKVCFITLWSVTILNGRKSLILCFCWPQFIILSPRASTQLLVSLKKFSRYRIYQSSCSWMKHSKWCSTWTSYSVSFKNIKILSLAHMSVILSKLPNITSGAQPYLIYWPAFLFLWS